jgi:thioredoxin reductase (NADPH)
MSLDPEQAPEALALLQQKGIDDSKLPVVLFGDDTALVQPNTTQLAEKAGLSTQAQQQFYDVVIVGAGPAGLAAGVYGASEGLRTLIVESVAPGGQAGSSSRIENYLGFPEGLSGEELGKRAFLQANRLGAEFLTQSVCSIRSENRYHIVRMADGSEVTCHVCLISTGVSYCMLEVPGADRFTGAGVYYGASQNQAHTCAGETVYLVGGANSAGQAAMHFARYAAQVHILVRADSIEKGMSKYLVDQIEATPNILVETCTEVVAMSGETRLECITVSGPRGQEFRQTNSLFIFIGAAPKTDWLPADIIRDSRGFILAGPDLKARNHWPANLGRDPYLLETNVPGIFVAGDARHGSVKRCASAVGEGSIAIQFVHQYLATL